MCAKESSVSLVTEKISEVAHQHVSRITTTSRERERNCGRDLSTKHPADHVHSHCQRLGGAH
eukprot:m.15740 g.15740  ORF g.15740 m.15740 type:complete len:62 (-) comp4954_c0_seq2:931-1116(-)